MHPTSRDRPPDAPAARTREPSRPAPPHPAPPFDAWAWLQALQQTWIAGLDPLGAGRWWREQRLASLIETARTESPFYARRAARARALQDFEPVRKGDLMAQFDAWCGDPRIREASAQVFVARTDTVADAWLDRYLLWTSSGTSGHPGIFVQDAASLAAYDAIDALRLRGVSPVQALDGLWGFGRRLAYVAAIGGHYAGHVGIERLRRLMPAAWAPRIERVSILEPMDRIRQRLVDLQPQVLVTYPSCASVLAQARAQGTLDIAPAEIWLGGEQLSAGQRAAIETAFGAVVRNCYGASEFMSIACECAHQRLHVNDDWVVLEPIDARGRPVEDGTFSQRTLLTNLANRVQPLIRYELADQVRFTGEACPCRSRLPVIEVRGRDDDTLWFRDARGHPVAVLPLSLESVIEERTGVTEFQLVCQADGRLELRLPDESRHDIDRCAGALRQWFGTQRFTAPPIESTTDAPERQPGSGKLRRVIDRRIDRLSPRTSR